MDLGTAVELFWKFLKMHLKLDQLITKKLLVTLSANGSAFTLPAAPLTPRLPTDAP